MLKDILYSISMQIKFHETGEIFHELGRLIVNGVVANISVLQASYYQRTSSDNSVTNYGKILVA
jgi:hypothetical protein